MEPMVRLDHECKVARNAVRRRRCKLRKCLMIAIPGIYIKDVQNIIIDYCMINRNVINMLHRLSCENGPEFLDSDLRTYCWDEKKCLYFYCTYIRFLAIGECDGDDDIIYFSIKQLIDALDCVQSASPHFKIDSEMWIRDSSEILTYIDRCMTEWS
jgi:uncharacterized Fe-S cluster protein YjdI